MWLVQTSTNENTTNIERVLHLCLSLDWRQSDVLLASTFTRGETLTFLDMHQMYADVYAHIKWISFIWRSRQIINEFWRKPSEWQRTDQNCSFFRLYSMCDTGKVGLCHFFKYFCIQNKFHVVFECVQGALFNDSAINQFRETIRSWWNRHFRLGLKQINSAQSLNTSHSGTTHCGIKSSVLCRAKPEGSNCLLCK